MASKSVWTDFLNTPGYSTDDVEKYGGHDQYVKYLREKERKFKGEEERLLLEHEWKKLHMNETTNIDMEAEVDMQSVAEMAVSYIKENPETFMLGEPCQLTVMRRDGKYSKRSHIGGEDFKPVNAYVGKRGKLIFVFQPVMVSDYEHMEMDESEAWEKLGGFATYMKRADNHEFERTRNAAKKAAADKAEREKLADREEQYGDMGFGSW